MAKKSKSKASSNNAKQQNKPCSCDHPYNCSCGNRPERPSRGHKWDPETQTWGGKGHKQKGASGQTSTVAKEAVTTRVGQTKIEQWQRLPTKLLDEVCQKQGRPRPKYKQIGSSGKFKYRVICQDPKANRRGTDHDIILVPASGASNEEQAKEEAALLALLTLTPNLPHERKLPEPYKTTWQHAVESSKTKQKKSESESKKKNAQPNSNSKTTTKKGSAAASASTNLTSATNYASLAEKKQQHVERQRIQKEKIRKHEAIRMANKDHQVFLSAQCRKRIETLLRGDDDEKLEKMLLQQEQEELEDNDNDSDDLKAYAIDRLVHEGFTRAQARAAYKEVVSPKNNNNSAGEEEWDRIHDECLQWLCIHLPEDQLPEGFDPKGATLDVVVAASAPSSSKDAAAIALPANVQDLCTTYGVTASEVRHLMKQQSKQQEINDAAFWDFIVNAANVDWNKEQAEEPSSRKENLEIARDEIETLQAIFSPEECQVQHDNRGEMTTIHLKIQSPQDDDDHQMDLLISVQDGVYPSQYPNMILLKNGWTGKLQSLGTALHVELVKLVKTFTRGEPMIYDIYGQVQSLLQSAIDGELAPLSLGERSSVVSPSPTASTKPQSTRKNGKEQTTTNDAPVPKMLKSRHHHRPRVRSFFWTKTTQETPPAVAFPKTSLTIANQRKNLPAAKARTEFLDKLKSAEKKGRVVLVTGSTGCGKTTQIPQFILEDSPLDSKIVVAQPRRLAATGVATRVANERGESQAGIASVGYVVRGDSQMCNSTRLMFCTTGVLLRQLQSSKALDCITHLIIDEVHERHLDTDVLLGVLKACLDTTPHLRVILMSATIDEDRFAAYFGNDTPRMHIEGRTFPVTDFTLEDVLSATGYVPPKRKGRGGGGYVQRDMSNLSNADNDAESAIESPEANTEKADIEQNNMPSLEERVKRVDENSVDYNLLGQLVKHLVQSTDCQNSSILVFLPGAPEINNAVKTLQKILRGMSVQLLPLHGGLQPKEQNLVFQKADRGWTKVICSTNIAETSITIEDCTVVIDSCREKIMTYDSSNRMPLLKECFASKASLKQRRGRAGRVRSGTCYKLISRSTFSKLANHGEPEIKRCALDQTLLSLLFLGLENGTGNFLSTLLDPPSRESIDAAIFSLETLGALEKETADGTRALTALGMHLAGIPAPPTVGKISILGCILGCRRAGVAMAAGMSVGRSPFLKIDTYKPYRRGGDEDEKSIEDMKKENILSERNKIMKQVGKSDHALLAAIYMEWDKLGAGAGQRKRYCEKLGLSFNGMRDMRQLASQLDSALSAIGYRGGSEENVNDYSWRIVRACAVAALAPSQLVRVHRPGTKYTETVEGAVERDGVAREIKFFIRGGSDDATSDSTTDKMLQQHRGKDERVFLHPSSTNFQVGSYNCPWLVYHELVRTSKAFLRDATECSAYALLLFGGPLEVQPSKGLIVIDEWVRLAANPRIGALIGGLRGKLDELLIKKVEDPSFDIAGTVEMRIIVNLLVTDGLGH